MKELPRQSGECKINIEDGIGFPSGKPLIATYKIAGVAVDVTGYTAKFELRDTTGGTGTELLALTEGAGITVGTTDGTFTVVITPAQANFGNREMEFGLVVYDTGGSPISLVRGICQSHAMAVN